MAIRDKRKKPYIEDRDDDIFIGIDLPFYKSNGKEGYFASTKTTIEAVKNNIRNLLKTENGERLMQPNLGVGLRRFLFEQLTEETILAIEDNIKDVFNFWLPFVEIQNLDVKIDEENQLIISIVFNIQQDPTTLDSVQVSIGSHNFGENNSNSPI
jgi:phage baseplate assembly protein W|tara:strand:+ start:547 stop:1011 length:465 start_codon:yes stop_codon:yes gene_type:complete